MILMKRFSAADVRKAIFDVKISRAIGYDELSANVFKNENIILFQQIV